MAQTELPAELVEMQSELERQNRIYAMLSQINRTIVRTEDPQELYLAACRIAIEYGGFALAWISLLEPGGQRVVPVAAAGAATIAQIGGISDALCGRGLTVQAAHAGSPIIINDTCASAHPEQWQGMTEQWGIRAAAAFPIRLDGGIIGAFNVAAVEPGRALFDERLGEACRDAAGKTVAVLVANLRRYHGIVQSLGSGTGQEIIRAMAARLDAALPTVAVARITESKFALMLREPAGLDVVEELAWSVHRALDGATHADGQELFLAPFVGIAVFPRDGEPAQVLKHAMQAAAIPTHDTGNRCRFFNADLDDGSRQRLNLDTALRRALERDEFKLHYQPQIDLASGRIVGAEALLRWQRPDHGLVAPQDFIPLLEDNGLIGAVGEWALHEACRRTKQWQDEGLPPIRIAVNLSARQFHEDNIRAMVRRTLDATQLDPRCLELELTEGIVLLNADSVIRTMHELNAEGITHALDDFGTGYSSLSYLQRLPVARIKIDHSFVTHVTSNPSDAAIARAVVGMAHSLGLSVIAEGVETEGQLGFLRGIGCEEIQGFLFSRALPEDEFAALLREGRRLSPGPTEPPARVLLLVDDEPSILSSLNRLLRRQGYRIVSTTSAREGFDLLAMHHPGVVICDQRMPEMTGTEFLRRVKELHPDTVRIVLSGYTELNSVIDAVNQGAVYKFLTKPWEEDSLIANIKDAFRIYELHRENRELSRLLQAR